MFSLNAREQLFLVAVAVVTVTGFAVKYWRDTRREMVVRPPAVASVPAAGIQSPVPTAKP